MTTNQMNECAGNLQTHRFAIVVFAIEYRQGAPEDMTPSSINLWLPTSRLRVFHITETTDNTSISISFQ